VARVFWTSELADTAAASLSPKKQTVERLTRQSCGRHSVEAVRWRLVRSLQLCFYTVHIAQMTLEKPKGAQNVIAPACY